jgi:hypothetical protein
MRPHTIAGALALCASASAFSDTSPLLLLSTAQLSQRQPITSEQLMTAEHATSMVDILLSTCPTDRYLLVSQPHVNAADLTTPEGPCAVPNLCRAMENEAIQHRFTIAEVFGPMLIHDISNTIKETCANVGKTVDVKEVILTSLPVVSKAQALADNDYLLRDSLEVLQADHSYTILYFAGPTEPMYEAQFAEPVRMDLKRQVAHDPRVYRRDPSSNTTDHRSLFDKYQFFTPGIFVGLLVTFFLLSILAVGVKALGSLEVPYGAFEKEMGPAAQKKQH